MNQSFVDHDRNSFIYLESRIASDSLNSLQTTIPGLLNERQFDGIFYSTFALLKIILLFIDMSQSSYILVFLLACFVTSNNGQGK